MYKMRNLLLLLLGVASVAAIACGSERIVEVPVDRPVIQTVEVEVACRGPERGRIKEVEIEVPVEIEREVIQGSPG